MKTRPTNTYHVQSETNKNRWYEVRLIRIGEHLQATCTCPHHTYRKVDCKHIERAITASIYGY